MSLAADSPSPMNSSSSSDDFAALIDAELGNLSDTRPDDNDNDDDDDEEEEEEEEEEDEDSEEVVQVDEDGERIKRRKVDGLQDSTELGSSTSFDAIQQDIDGSANMGTCRHPVFLGDMCVTCGKRVEDRSESAVALGYIHKDLKIGAEEMARLRGSDLKKLLRNKKLYLVLDLDHTLLNSTRLIDVSPEEEYLKSQTDSLQDISNGSLFKLDTMHLMTKLRPHVRTFLKEASSMYEMYVYTMGERSYALEMARLLDPERVFFNSKVISQGDCTQKHQKGLDVVLGADNAVVILDDTEFVWSKHKENLILIERYHYFRSSCRQYGVSGKSLSESKRDENETDGALATVLEVLKQVHQSFFDSVDADSTSKDVRQVLKTIRQEVLKGCNIVFSRVWKLGERPENQRLWEMAIQLGATCSAEVDSSVTHVVSTDPGTEKARWAVKHKKFLVHPWWIEAANYLWKRQSEEKFPVNQIEKQ